MHAFALISVGSRGTSPRRPNRPGPLMSTLPSPPPLPSSLLSLSLFLFLLSPYSLWLLLPALQTTLFDPPGKYLVRSRTDYRQPAGPPPARVSLSPN